MCIKELQLGLGILLVCAATGTGLRADDALGGNGNPPPRDDLLTLRPALFDDGYVVPGNAHAPQSSLAQRLTLDVTTAPAAGEGQDSPEELAKKLNNPVADLISVPFQFNADFGIGPHNASRSTLNIQPVVPISITKDWNLIVRTILPVVYAASPAQGVSSDWGLGDTTQTFFFSPKEPVGGWILGAGPVALWPTATNDALGSGKWGAGPSVLALRQEHGWTYGILANHIWSYAAAGERTSVNATFLQPFIAYTFPTLTTLALNSESTYDWTARQWSIPLNLMVSQLVKIGKAPVQFQFGGRYYAQGPSGGPEWGVRFTVTLLFPK